MDVVPIALFVCIAAGVIAPFYFRSRDRAKLLDTVRVAYERGQPVPPELVEALQARQKPFRPSAETDLRSGVIWLAVGLGLAFFGWMLGFADDDMLHPVIGMSSIPILVGLALIAFGVISRDKAR